MRLRLHHVLVVLGLGLGLLGATFFDTEPRYIGWCFAVGAGLTGGAFVAALISGDALASGPAARNTRSGRGPTRPAWFDEPDRTPPAPPADDADHADGHDDSDRDGNGRP